MYMDKMRGILQKGKSTPEIAKKHKKTPGLNIDKKK